jgi:hypothetical protein
VLLAVSYTTPLLLEVGKTGGPGWTLVELLGCNTSVGQLSDRPVLLHEIEPSVSRCWQAVDR